MSSKGAAPIYRYDSLMQALPIKPKRLIAQFDMAFFVMAWHTHCVDYQPNPRIKHRENEANVIGGFF